MDGWQSFLQKELTNPYPRTPAMAAGVSDHIWTTEEIVVLINAYTAYHHNQTKECGTYLFYPYTLAFYGYRDR